MKGPFEFCPYDKDSGARAYSIISGNYRRSCCRKTEKHQVGTWQWFIGRPAIADSLNLSGRLAFSRLLADASGKRQRYVEIDGEKRSGRGRSKFCPLCDYSTRPQALGVCAATRRDCSRMHVRRPEWNMGQFLSIILLHGSQHIAS